MGASEFEPIDLTAVKAWWDPLSGITKDGSNLVSSWVDRITGTAVTQSTSGDQPTYQPSGAGSTVLGNRPCLQLGATTATYLQSASAISTLPTGTSDMWLFTVCKLSNGVGSAAMIAGYGSQALSIGITGDGSLPVGKFSCLYRDQAFGFNGTNILSANAVIDTSFTNSATTGRLNGTTDATGPAALSNSNEAFVIGIRPHASTEYPVGYIGDVIVTSTLTTDERDKLEGYLAWKYGLQASLDAAHPYRHTPP